MHLEGVTIIKAPRQKVWEFLIDPHQVSQCAPGVESVEIIEPNRKFRAVASIGLGSVKARFSGNAEFLELDAPNRAKIKGHGSAPGSASVAKWLPNPARYAVTGRAAARAALGAFAPVLAVMTRSPFSPARSLPA